LEGKFLATPNYKQQKKLREQQQKKKKDEKEQRKAEKKAPTSPLAVEKGAGDN
jgi:hypothetical protein